MIYITGQLAAIRLDIRDFFDYIEALTHEDYKKADEILGFYHKRLDNAAKLRQWKKQKKQKGLSL